MPDTTRTLAVINEKIQIDYIDGRRKRADHTLNITHFKAGKTKAGTYRIWITARDISGINKTYSFARIRSVIDLSSGEIFDQPSKWGAEIIAKYKGFDPDHWPFEYARTTQIPWGFNPDTFPVFKDFAFGIGRGHLAEIDIKLEDIPPKKGTNGTKGRKRVAYTIGNPQRLEFERGSVYHMPPLVGQMARATWAEQTKFLHCTIQVLEQIDKDSDDVRFTLFDHVLRTTSQYSLDVCTFERILRTGDLNILMIIRH